MKKMSPLSDNAYDICAISTWIWVHLDENRPILRYQFSR